MMLLWIMLFMLKAKMFEDYVKVKEVERCMSVHGTLLSRANTLPPKTPGT